MTSRCDDHDATGSPCASDASSSEDMSTLVRSGEVGQEIMHSLYIYRQIELVEAVEDAQINGELPVTYDSASDASMQVRLTLNCFGVCICDRKAPYVRVNKYL